MKFRNGRWLTKKRAKSFSPKTVYETDASDGKVTLFVRENSVIPVGIVHPNAEYGFKGNVELRVYGLTGRAETEVYDGEDVIIKACFDKAENSYTVTGGAGCRIRFGDDIIELTEDIETGEINR